MEDELFEIYDEQGSMIGKDIRKNAHAYGLWHAVVHVWVYDDEWVYIQQRSYQKRDYAGKYDITTAGHVDVGEATILAALRECKEEIGLVMDEEHLQYIGNVKEVVFLPSMKDKEIAYVYVYKDENPIFSLGEEVEGVYKIKKSSLEDYANDRKRGIIVYTLNETDCFPICDSDMCNHASIYYQWLLEKMR